MTMFMEESETKSRELQKYKLKCEEKYHFFFCCGRDKVYKHWRKIKFQHPEHYFNLLNIERIFDLAGLQINNHILVNTDQSLKIKGKSPKYSGPMFIWFVCVLLRTFKLHFWLSVCFSRPVCLSHFLSCTHKYTHTIYIYIYDVCVCVYIYIYPALPPRMEFDTRSIFKWILLIWVFFLLDWRLTKAKESILPFYLTLAEGEWWKDGFMPFRSALVQSDTQTTSTEI